MRRTQFHLLRSRRFAPLFVTQFLGAMNDNLFKNALIVLIIFRIAEPAGLNGQVLVTAAAGIFILPFFLFSATAGQLADKFEKSTMIRWIKTAEVVIMGLGAASFWFADVYLMIFVLFLMGVQSAFFGPLKYSILPDHLSQDELIGGNAFIEAGTFLLAGASTGGDVEVVGAVPHHLDSLITKLGEAGVDVTLGDATVRVCCVDGLEPVQLQAVPYPGFPTDLHAPMAAMLTQARGVSIIHERVFENRLLYVGELRAMGARITTGGQVVMIEGPSSLTGTSVRALDLRAGAAVVIAGLCAEGETEVRDIVHLDRGYSHLVERLQELGADVERRSPPPSAAAPNV